MSPSELRALLTVHNETRVLAEAYRSDSRAIEGLRTLLGLYGDDLPKEVLEGMADFAQNLARVAGIRERLAREEKRPEGKKEGQRELRYWWDHFVEPIEDDGFFLGQAVATMLVKAIDELSSRSVVNDEGIRRWASRTKGARLAAALYLDVLSDGWGL
jgi:hypothetical protein